MSKKYEAILSAPFLQESLFETLNLRKVDAPRISSFSLISRVLTKQIELAASPLVGLARIDVLAEAHALREALAESLTQLASHALAQARLAHLLRA